MWKKNFSPLFAGFYIAAQHMAYHKKYPQWAERRHDKAENYHKYNESHFSELLCFFVWDLLYLYIDCTGVVMMTASVDAMMFYAIFL